jgi:hypothetical protein
VRFSSTARSDGWVITGYNNQSNPGTFYTVGSAESSAALQDDIATDCP